MLLQIRLTEISLNLISLVFALRYWFGYVTLRISGASSRECGYMMTTEAASHVVLPVTG